MITSADGGFRFEAGTYVLVPRNWSGSFLDPRAERNSPSEEFHLPEPSEPAITGADDLTVLVVPVGKDSAGCPVRTVAVGRHTIVLSGYFAIVAMPEGEPVQQRHYPYASHLAANVVLDVENEGFLDIRELIFHGFRGVQMIDLRTPGAFWIDGAVIDMSDEAIAAAFEYGSHSFNTSLDEHGFHVMLDPVRDRLRAQSDGASFALLAALERRGASAIAYFAPVAD